MQDLQSRLDTDHGAKAEIALTLQNVQTKSGQLEKTVSYFSMDFYGTGGGGVGGGGCLKTH